MAEHQNPEVRSRARLPHAGVAIVADLTAHLIERGHAPSTVERYGLAVAHFISWTSTRGVPLVEVHEATLRAFVEQHLPRCQCTRPGPRSKNTVRAALNHLLERLRQRDIAPQQRPGISPAILDAVQEFEAHLRDTCGLSEATRLYRRRYVREFLEAIYGTGPVDPVGLTPADVIRYFSSRVRHCKPGSAQVIASSLRSYLRFQQLLGHCDAGPSEAVPTVAHWRLSGLPQLLSETQLRQLLAAFDRTTATGRRDYAMVRCLVDLALRAGEVARLRLDDIDWSQGTISFRTTKSRRQDVLPVPATVGRAIASYVRHGRPCTPERTVFVRHVVPIGCALSPFAVRNAVRCAAARAGFRQKWIGTHILRHTAATRMLRRGTTLKEVADVLRHRSLDTTAIYTKIDLPRLAMVALPWPEAER